ncbi:MAG: cytochrome-c peroxidase [bacterium]|nr:cytochrome-c peroxidase [bacterium]
MRHLSVFLLVLLGLVLITPACGGGGSDDGTDVGDAGGGDDDPTLQEPTQLDLDFQALCDEEGLTPAAPIATSAQPLVDLGRALFFDKVLSGNHNTSCATCHHPAEHTGDGLSVSIGEGGTGTGRFRQLAAGQLIPRHAPHIFNLGAPEFRSMFWDGRVRVTNGGRLQTPEPALNGAAPTAGQIAAQLTTALAAQAMFPVTSPAEMRGQPGTNEIANATSNLEVWDLLMARLVGEVGGTVGGIQAYRDLFVAAYPGVTSFDDFNFGHAARAIAAYEGSAYRATSAPLDLYLGGDLTAMPDEAKRGGILFMDRARCIRCHRGSHFTDHQFHSVGVPQVGPGAHGAGEDLGLFGETGDSNDLYRFRTPSLRNVELTGPWMHDGAFTSLQNVVRHYINPEQSLRNYDANQLSPLLQPTVDTDTARIDARANAISNIARRPIRLTLQEQADLLAFLVALTDNASRDLSAEVPASVPSGLPVAD